MINKLQTQLAQADGRLQIGFSLLDGGGATAILVAVDEIGVALEVSNELYYYPWSALKRIRVQLAQ